jgi:broad specificity phosphatase PhoE
MRPGGGENRREFEQRARSALAKLVDAYPGRRLAVVTHLGVIRSLLGEACGLACGGGSGSVPADCEAEFDNAGWRRLTPAELGRAVGSHDGFAGS